MKKLILSFVLALGFGLGAFADFLPGLSKVGDSIGEVTGIQPGRWAGEAVENMPHNRYPYGEESHLPVMPRDPMPSEFNNPKIKGKYIDACLESGCSKDASNLIAHQFCRYYGYSSWANWSSRDFGWESRTNNLQWKQEYTSSNNRGFFDQHEGANRFTFIKCKQ